VRRLRCRRGPFEIERLRLRRATFTAHLRAFTPGSGLLAGTCFARFTTTTTTAAARTATAALTLGPFGTIRARRRAAGIGHIGCCFGGRFLHD